MKPSVKILIHVAEIALAIVVAYLLAKKQIANHTAAYQHEAVLL